MEKLALGEKIALLRTRKKLSKRALSSITGIHWVTLGKYESNIMEPSAEGLRKIVSALNTSADYLLFDDYTEKQVTSILDSELLQLAEKTDQLPEQEKNFIKNTISNYLKSKHA